MRKRVLSLVVTLLVLLALSLEAAAEGAAPGAGQSGALASEVASWPMAGANPERTSWTPEEVRGKLKPLWYKTFEPYISQKVQIIAANDTLYISTARGLYALDAATGAEKWVYPTEFPLGHSPTIYNGVAYVGGFDRKLHAINAATGAGLWTFEAGAGFHTNPLVVGGKVYAGNRDGYFYALYADGPNAGQLAWKYQTGGPILFSAAYKDGVVYFASNDSYAYALNAQTGGLVWKSQKLPGAGFHSWWPVVYRDYVIFAGSNNYRNIKNPFGGALNNDLEKADIYPNHQSDPRGTLVGPLGQEAGDWAAGTPTIDTSKSNVTANGSTTPITEYFEQKPWRRTYFVLNRTTGQEYTTDFDHDGKPEYAPILWFGTQSGNRYPPVVGGDGVIYQLNNYRSDPYIPGGQISGWKIGTPFISIVSSDWGAVDEPHAYAAGGNVIYWNLCCDREAEAFDVSIPNSSFGNAVASEEMPAAGNADASREWTYFTYDLDAKVPGYNSSYYMSDTSPYAAFGGPNGVYGYHGDTNAPIPYKGKVYMHRGNSIIAFGTTTSAPVALPTATTVPVQSAMTPLGVDKLKARLEEEIQKILDAGHLRPGYTSHGLFDARSSHQCGDALVDYWHQPAETIYILSQALPHLSPQMQQNVRNYLQNEFAAYPPYEYNHVGWRDGAAREAFDLPPEVAADFVNYPPSQENYTFKNDGGWGDEGIWGRNPFMFYAMWKYAEIFGGAKAIFDASRNRLESPPSDTALKNMPLVHNAFIAGYLGYLELEKLAGYPETASVRTELNRLLQLRAASFTKDSAYFNKASSKQGAYCRTLNVASNFMFLVPELAEYLRENAMGKVQAALDEYFELAPYWFVAFAEEGFAENAIAGLNDSNALFQARALILQESGDELERYLDVPAFARGDLYYIQNLVAALDNQSYGFTLSANPSVRAIDPGDSANFTVEIKPTGGFTETATLNVVSPSPDLNVSLAPTTLSLPGQAALTLDDTHSSGPLLPGVWYTVPITGTGGGVTRTLNISLLVGGARGYLPLIRK